MQPTLSNESEYTMASLGMIGPFVFSQQGIDENVPEKLIGNYALGRTDPKDNCFVVIYVGRSTDVRKRLHDHLNDSDKDWTDVPLFKFSEAPDELSAYEKECQNWHDFGGESNKLKNVNHPAKLEGESYLECPVCKQ